MRIGGGENGQERGVLNILSPATPSLAERRQQAALQLRQISSYMAEVERAYDGAVALCERLGVFLNSDNGCCSDGHVLKQDNARLNNGRIKELEGALASARSALDKERRKVQELEEMALMLRSEAASLRVGGQPTIGEERGNESFRGKFEGLLQFIEGLVETLDDAPEQNVNAR